MGQRPQSAVLQFYRHRGRLYEFRVPVHLCRQLQDELHADVRLVLRLAEQSRARMVGRAVSVQLHCQQQRRRGPFAAETGADGLLPATLCSSAAHRGTFITRCSSRRWSAAAITSAPILSTHSTARLTPISMRRFGISTSKAYASRTIFRPVALPRCTRGGEYFNICTLYICAVRDIIKTNGPPRGGYNDGDR